MVCAPLSGDLRGDVLICWSPFRGGTNVRRSVIVRSQLPAQAMMFQGGSLSLAVKLALYSIEAIATHIWVVDVFSPAVLCDTAKHAMRALRLQAILCGAQTPSTRSNASARGS